MNQGNPGPTVGRTWADIFKEFMRSGPMWIVSACLVVVVGVYVYATQTTRCFTLPFVGEAGNCGDRPSGIPAEAVIAFASECPLGWERYEQAASRFIIGASTTDELEEGPSAFRTGSNGDALSERPLGHEGGSERVKLDIRNIPEHRHATGIHLAPNDERGFGKENLDAIIDLVAVTATTATTDDGSMLTNFQGGSEPHDNMPPYVALYFCKQRTPR